MHWAFNWYAIAIFFIQILELELWRNKNAQVLLLIVLANFIKPLLGLWSTELTMALYYI